MTDPVTRMVEPQTGRRVISWQFVVGLLALAIVIAAVIIGGAALWSHLDSVEHENTQLSDSVTQLSGQVKALGGTPVAGSDAPTATNGANGQNGRNGESIVGPTGPAGPAGIGTNGANGANGQNGLTGLTGATGADSTVPGPAGPPGADSTVPGPAGPPGSTGSEPPEFDWTFSVGVSTYHVTCTLQIGGVGYDCVTATTLTIPTTGAAS